MNPQTPEMLNAPEVSSETREGALSRAISCLKTQTSSAVAVLALSCSLGTGALEAQENHTLQTVSFSIPEYSGDNNLLEISEVEYNGIVDNFIVAIDSLELGGNTEIANGMTAEQILQGIKYSGNLDSLFDKLILEFQINGGDAVAALETIYSQMGVLALRAVEHSEAITLARSTFIDNSLLINPSYTQGRLARAPDEVKRERAGISFDHNLQAILGNNPEALTSEGLTEFVQYTHDFTEVYLMSDLFEGEFPQEYLQGALENIELIIEGENLRAEGERIEEETRALFIEFREKVAQTRAAM